MTNPTAITAITSVSASASPSLPPHPRKAPACTIQTASSHERSLGTQKFNPTVRSTLFTSLTIYTDMSCNIDTKPEEVQHAHFTTNFTVDL